MTEQQLKNIVCDIFNVQKVDIACCFEGDDIGSEINIKLPCSVYNDIFKNEKDFYISSDSCLDKEFNPINNGIADIYICCATDNSLTISVFFGKSNKSYWYNCIPLSEKMHLLCKLQQTLDKEYSDASTLDAE